MSRIRKQLPLMQAFISHEHGQELAAMDKILDSIRSVLAPIRHDLTKGCSARRGRAGMTAAQVLRALIVKQLNGFSYAQLSFHLEDSTCYRSFCHLGAFDATPSRSTLQENIKKLSPQTLQKVHEAIVHQAMAEGMEDGKRLRVDCTVTETNIHEPTDSSLLWDVVRVLVGQLRRARVYGAKFSNHQRRAKRRWLGIQNAKRMKYRVPLYRDLMRITESTCDDAVRVAEELEAVDEPRVRRIVTKLREVEELGRRVLDQTRRRVLDGETVPALEKVVSIFESHTDIIVKGNRGTEYGHKLCLATGVSGLITDCTVEGGNPADVTLATKMIDRHKALFGEVPEQAAFDGGFASRNNLKEIKERGVEDVAFNKRCGLAITDMVRSSWIYKTLRDFRAGIEGMISFLKRCFGLNRCSWRSLESFYAYVLSSVATANLLLLARHRLRE